MKRVYDFLKKAETYYLCNGGGRSAESASIWDGKRI